MNLRIFILILFSFFVFYGTAQKNKRKVHKKPATNKTVPYKPIEPEDGFISEEGGKIKYSRQAFSRKNPKHKLKKEQRFFSKERKFKTTKQKFKSVPFFASKKKKQKYWASKKTKDKYKFNKKQFRRNIRKSSKRGDYFARNPQKAGKENRKLANPSQKKILGIFKKR